MPWSDIDPRTGKRRVVFGSDVQLPSGTLIGSNKTAITGGGPARTSSANLSPDERRDLARSGQNRVNVNRGATEEGAIGNYSPPTNKPPVQKSLADALLEMMGGDYPGGAGDGKLDMSALDEALKARLGIIGDIRNQTQANYGTSDKNLAGMFGAASNEAATAGAQRFADIGREHAANLAAIRDQSIAGAKADQAEQQARRLAMLRNTGTEEAAPALTAADTEFARAISGAGERGNIALNQAETSNAANQAYNQSVVQSLNAMGAERRAALTQQLQGILGKLGMAEAEAKNQDATQRAQIQASAQGNDYQRWKDRQDRIYDIWKTVQANENKAGQPVKAQGYEGITQDLLNGGIDPDTAGKYTGALAQVLNSPRYNQAIQSNPNADRASIIVQSLTGMGVPVAIAARMASNYSNLGNVNAYTAL